MYRLLNINEKNLEYIVLESADGNSKAKLCLSQGGRIHHLVFNTIEVIERTEPSIYRRNYDSAILFPFANRVKNGEYKFNDVSYILDCNEDGRNNALHGLVYDKMFECISEKLTSDFASITLRYKNDGKSKGFPFKYDIELHYKLSKNEISLTVNICNMGKKIFPFTLGWHPYFKSKNLQESSLNFKSNIMFEVDKYQIPFRIIDFNETMPFQLKDKKLDTGYKLESNQVEFLTPEYQIKIKSNSNENYLQLYTPSESNSIAIEPMTGATDSFNNTIGLQTLSPNTNYNVEWKIIFKNSTTKTTNSLN